MVNFWLGLLPPCQYCNPCTTRGHRSPDYMVCQIFMVEMAYMDNSQAAIPIDTTFRTSKPKMFVFPKSLVFNQIHLFNLFNPRSLFLLQLLIITVENLPIWAHDYTSSNMSSSKLVKPFTTPHPNYYLNLI